MKIAHILLPTDLSEEARRPYADVVDLAKSFGAKITLLHVVQDLHVAPHGAPLAPPLSAPDTPKRVEEAKLAMDEECGRLRDGVEVQGAVVSHDNLAAGIVGYAAENAVDLIALSTHGRTGFRRLAIGSVAEAVLRHSAVPVLSFHRTNP